MIATDGKRTIANAGPVPVKRKTASERIREARMLRDVALEAALLTRDFVGYEGIRRGPQANGIEWNDGYCNCGVAICDSPAGDKCWDCFNHEPGE